MTERPETVTGEPRSKSLRSRLLGLVVRPTARPLGWGIVVAFAFIAGETLLVAALKRTAPEHAFGAIFLLGVLVVSAGWSFGLALATSLVSAVVYLYFHLEGGDSLAPALFVFLPLALLGERPRRAGPAPGRRIRATPTRGGRAGQAAGGAAMCGHAGGTRCRARRGLPRRGRRVGQGPRGRARHPGPVRRRTSTAPCWPRTMPRAARNCKWENDFHSTVTASRRGFARTGAAARIDDYTRRRGDHRHPAARTRAALRGGRTRHRRQEPPEAR